MRTGRPDWKWVRRMHRAWAKQMRMRMSDDACVRGSRRCNNVHRATPQYAQLYPAKWRRPAARDGAYRGPGAGA